MAVNSFAISVDVRDGLEAIRQSLGGVTSGLGRVETTLVALIDLHLMIPTNWLQKREDDLLTAVGSYCNEELLWRLEETRAGWGRRGRGRARPDRMVQHDEASREAWRLARSATWGRRIGEGVEAAWARGRIDAQARRAVIEITLEPGPGARSAPPGRDCRGKPADVAAVACRCASAQVGTEFRQGWEQVTGP